MTPPQPELIDYLRIAWRWKWLIVVSTMTAIAVALWGPIGPADAYVASCPVDIGVPSEQATKDLRYVVASVNRRPIGGTVTLDAVTAGLMTFEARGSSETDARTRLQAVIDAVTPDIEKIVDVERRWIASTERRRGQLESYASELRNLQVALTRREGAANGAVLFAAISGELARLDYELAALEIRSAGSVAPGVRRGEVTVSRAAGASRRLVASVVAVAALIAFVCVAFFAEYVRSARETPSSSKPIAPATRVY